MAEPYPWLQATWQYLQQQYRDEHLPHGLLFCGAAGMGKSTLVEHLASLLLCQQASDIPCGQCRGCQLLKAGNHPDLLRIKPEPGKQIGVEEIRQVIYALSETAHQCGARVVILEQAEKLTENAANALLKTLEEPGQGTYLLLTTPSAATMLPTITSRCQVITVNTPTEKEVMPWLQQQHPQINVAHLRLNGGAPLATLAFYEQGQAELSVKLCQLLNEWFCHRLTHDELSRWLTEHHPYACHWLFLYCRDLQTLRAAGNKLIFAKNKDSYQKIINTPSACLRLDTMLENWHETMPRLQPPGINLRLQYQAWLAECGRP